jgi:hypothetical protein
MAQSFRHHRSAFLFVVISFFALATQLSAQTNLEFRRIDVNWPDVELVFVTRCDTGVVWPADISDVHVLEDGVVRYPTSLRTSGIESIARFTGDCPNGRSHRIQMAVTISCGTTPVQSMSYTAPNIPSQVRALRIAVDSTRLAAGIRNQVPVRLLDPVLGAHVQSYTARVQFNSSVATVVGVSAPAGTLLEGTTISFTPGPPAEISFNSPAPAYMNDTGVLFFLELDVPFRSDTACMSLTLNPTSTVLDDYNCTSLAFLPGYVCAAPPTPRLVCDPPVLPDTLRWDAGRSSYLPAPLTYKAIVRNVGTGDARTPVFRLIWNPAEIVLQTGFPDTVIGRPARVSPGATSMAEWRFDVPPQSAESFVTRVGVEVEYPDGQTVTCSKDVVLYRRPSPVLECGLSAPAVAWNETLKRYLPMPLPLTVNVTNLGSGATDTVFAEVLLPSGLELARGESGLKTLTPAKLDPGWMGSAEWMLHHDPTPVEKVYDVVVRVWSANTPMDSCSTTITIPPGSMGAFAFDLTASGPLSFCEGDSVLLDGGSGYASWLWSTGDTTQMLHVTASGQYWCEVRDGNGRPGLSDTLAITVWPLPPVPGIVRDGNILRSTGAAGLRHQWYRDGWPLAGETADTLRLPDTGLYVLHVYSAEDCEAISLPFDVSVLSAEVAVADDAYMLQSWPEPAAELVSIELRVPAGRSVTLLLVDLLGRSEILFDGVPADGRLRLPLDLRSRASGSWLLQLRSGDVLRTRRITRL